MCVFLFVFVLWEEELLEYYSCELSRTYGVINNFFGKALTGHWVFMNSVLGNNLKEFFRGNSDLHSHQPCKIVIIVQYPCDT